jgi:hypothetical protein
MNWIKNRLKERSTYVGLAALATVAGVNVQPEHVEVISIVGGLAGAWGVSTKG